MGGSVEVITSELHQAADRFRGAGQQLQDGLSSVDLETTNLLASGWKGDAASAFAKYWEQWHQGAGQVVRGLQTMSELLTAAANDYTATDEQSAGALNSTMQGSGVDAGSPGAGGAPTAGGAVTPSAAGGGTPAASQQAEMASALDPGQALQPLSQLGQMPAQLAGGLMQAGQQAVQVAAGLAQQAAQAEVGDGADGADNEKGESKHDARGDAPLPEGAVGSDGSAAPVEAAQPGRAGSDTESPTNRRTTS